MSSRGSQWVACAFLAAVIAASPRDGFAQFTYPQGWLYGCAGDLSTDPWACLNTAAFARCRTNWVDVGFGSRVCPADQFDSLDTFLVNLNLTIANTMERLNNADRRIAQVHDALANTKERLDNTDKRFAPIVDALSQYSKAIEAMRQTIQLLECRVRKQESPESSVVCDKN